MLRELSLKAKARRRSGPRPDPAAPSPPPPAAPALRALRASLNAQAGATFSTAAPPPAAPPPARAPPRGPRAGGGLAGLRASLKHAPPAAAPAGPGKPRGTPPLPPAQAPRAPGVVPARDGPPRRAPGLTAPLLSAAELLSWRPAGALARCVSRVPLPQAAVARYARGGGGGGGGGGGAGGLAQGPGQAQSQAQAQVKRIQPPRLLLCHDFAQGYPEWEAAADGVFGDECPPDHGMWRFNHWAYVDLFVYYSHYRVTVPPVGYIHAAHRHGALALGTLIFEHADGAADLRQLLASFRVRAKAASQLATIAKFHGFDGWLVNVEVALPSPQAAGDLAAFVADLTRATRKLVGAASEVIWYDAVVRTGELRWQNELNAENEPFFKAAGAIFTNYHWDRGAPVRSAVKAGPRRTDVFTGIDVYGRNTYGGGGLQTHVALRPIKQSGTSAAIFAPAWTVERCPPNAANPDELEERFWTGPRGKFGRESVAQYFRERAVITELPFATNFDPGWGPHTVKNGLVVDERRYFNMSRQDVQPSFLRTAIASGDPSAASLALSSDAAIQGSAAVRVRYAFSASRMMSGTYTMMRLFIASLALSPPHPAARAAPSARTAAAAAPSSTAASTSPPAAPKQSLRVAYDYRVEKGRPEAADTFGVVLLLNSPAVAVLLVGESSKWATEAAPNVGAAAIPVHAPSVPAAGSVLVTTRLQILGKYVPCNVVTPTREVAVPGPPASDPGKWYSRVYDLPQPLVVGQRVAEVLVLVGDPPVQPQSVAPSPFMTPSGSRAASRFGSRFGSRNASRNGSRPGSRPLSRQSSRPGSRSGSPPRAEDLLASLGEMSGVERSSSGLGGVLRRDTSRRFSRTHVDMFDNDDASGGSVARPGGGAGHAVDRFGPEARAERRRGGRRDSAYANAFAVGGSMDFAEMEAGENGGGASWSSNTSRAISRLSSRLGTPSGSRPASRILSRLASRQGSNASSLAVSRTGSLAGSRTMTPLTGGAGALPLLSAVLTGGGIRSGVNTPTRLSAAPLRDLKTALMHAAGSMAGVGATGAQAEAGGRNTLTVYLGSLRLEYYDVSDGSDRRASSGFDNDFFNALPTLPTSTSQRRLSRRHGP